MTLRRHPIGLLLLCLALSACALTGPPRPGPPEPTPPCPEIHVVARTPQGLRLDLTLPPATATPPAKLVILRAQDDDIDYTPLLTVNLGTQLAALARDGGTVPYEDIDLPKRGVQTLRYGLALRDEDDKSVAGCALTPVGTSITLSERPIQEAVSLQVEVVGRVVKVKAADASSLRLYRRDVRAKQPPVVLATDWNPTEPFIDVSTVPGHVYAYSAAREAPLEIAPEQDRLAVDVSARGPEAYAVVRPMDRLIRVDAP